VNNNGRTAGPNAPNFEAQKEVMAAALRESGKRADEVEEIEASGAGSVVADLLELKAIEAVFGGRGRPPCYLGSVKANVGHLLSAAGLASFVKAVLSLARAEHPPFLSADQLPLHFDFERAGIAFARESRPWTGARTACVTSFPDGGTNCCVVLESYAGGSTREPLPGPFFRKQSLKPGKAVAVAVNGKGDDFWGLTE
jgi:polyketide synthase PksL